MAPHPTAARGLPRPSRRFRLPPGKHVPSAAPGPAPADSLASLWAELRAAASALGTPEQGVQLVSRLRQRVAAISGRAATRPRVRVACLGSAAPPARANGWTCELLALAGGEDALAEAVEAGAPLPPGALAAADPDLIVLAPREEGLEAALAAAHRLAATADGRELRAVRGARVVVAAGGELFERPGPRVAEALEILAEALHPEAFRFGHEGRRWLRGPAAG